MNKMLFEEMDSFNVNLLVRKYFNIEEVTNPELLDSADRSMVVNACKIQISIYPWSKKMYFERNLEDCRTNTEIVKLLLKAIRI